MPVVDLTSYRIAPGEKPASAAKQNNMLTALENAFNAPVQPNEIVGYPSDATKYLDGSGNWSVPPPPPIPPGLVTVYTKTTSTDIVNTNTKADLFAGAFTIPGGTVGATGVIKLMAGGDYLNASGANQTIVLELRLGGVALWVSNASDPISSVATFRHGWHLSTVIQAMNNTAAQQASGDFTLGAALSGVTGSGGMTDPSGTAARALFCSFLSVGTTVNMAGANQTLTFSVTHSATNANLSMRCQYARLEVIP